MLKMQPFLSILPRNSFAPSKFASLPAPTSLYMISHVEEPDSLITYSHNSTNKTIIGTVGNIRKEKVNILYGICHVRLLGFQITGTSDYSKKIIGRLTICWFCSKVL